MMLNEEELKKALEHDAHVPAAQKHGTSSPATDGHIHGSPGANPVDPAAALSKLARTAACVAVNEVLGALRSPLEDDETLDYDSLEKLVRLAERLDVLADKAQASGASAKP